MFNDEHPVKNLPTTEELDKAIKEFVSINWKTVSKNNLEKIIPWPLKAMSILSIDFPHSSYLYRARSFHSFPTDQSRDKDNIYLSQSFSYPPPKKARMNRANYEGQPIFYAASNLMAAVIESQSDGHLDFIGCWKMKSGCAMRIRPYIGNIPAEIQDCNDNFISRMKQQYEKILANCPDKDVILQLDKFHDQQFTKLVENSEEYLYTAWLANRNLCEHRNREGCKDIIPDAIMFQCTKDDRLGTNLAIHKDFADTSLILEEAYLITHTFDQSVKKFKRLLLSYGQVEDEHIVWRKPNSDDLKRFMERHHVPVYACNRLK